MRLTESQPQPNLALPEFLFFCKKRSGQALSKASSARLSGALGVNFSQDFWEENVSVTLCYLKELDILSLLYLGDQPAAFQGDRSEHPFLRIQNLFHDSIEWGRQTLHFTDLINDDHIGRRVKK